MILVPMVVLLVAYQLGWYGFATLKQPVPCGGNNTSTSSSCGEGCCGFMDLLLPSKVGAVDTCITNSWGNNTGSTNNNLGAALTPTYGSYSNQPDSSKTPSGNPIPPTRVSSN